MTAAFNFTPQQLADIKQRRAAKEPFASIAASYGCHHVTIRRIFSPETYRRPSYKMADVLIARAEFTVTKQDAAARLAEIPDDTRDLTQRMFGDPIPGDPRRPWRKDRHA